MAAAAQVLSPGTTSHSTSPGPEVPRCSVGVLITSSFRVPRALMRGRTVSPHSVLIAGFFEGSFVTNRLTPSVWSSYGNVRSSLSKAEQTMKRLECW